MFSWKKMHIWADYRSRLIQPTGFTFPTRTSTILTRMGLAKPSQCLWYISFACIDNYLEDLQWKRWALHDGLVFCQPEAAICQIVDTHGTSWDWKRLWPSQGWLKVIPYLHYGVSRAGRWHILAGYSKWSYLISLGIIRGAIFGSVISLLGFPIFCDKECGGILHKTYRKLVYDVAWCAKRCIGVLIFKHLFDCKFWRMETETPHKHTNIHFRTYWPYILLHISGLFHWVSAYSVDQIFDNWVKGTIFSSVFGIMSWFIYVTRRYFPFQSKTLL